MKDVPKMTGEHQEDKSEDYGGGGARQVKADNEATGVI